MNRLVSGLSNLVFDDSNGSFSVFHSFFKFSTHTSTYSYMFHITSFDFSVGSEQPVGESSEKIG